MSAHFLIGMLYVRLAVVRLACECDCGAGKCGCNTRDDGDGGDAAAVATGPADGDDSAGSDQPISPVGAAAVVAVAAVEEWMLASL